MNTEAVNDVVITNTETLRFENSLDYAQLLDNQDPLKHFRSKFFIPQHQGKDVVYFTGNSLGLQPKAVSTYLDAVLKDWAGMGVMGHHHGEQPWIPYHEQFAEPVSKIVGAKPNEVVVMNQLTVNLHLLLTTFYRPTKQRFKIVCEAKAFPSDQYAIESQVKLHGFNPEETIIKVSPWENEFNLRLEDIVSTIQTHGDTIALVLFGGINYYTGQVFDIKNITVAAHEVGAYAGFDLAHAAGNIALKLHDWKVDFACWCSYKYINSSPGGISGVYIHEKHAANTSLPRMAGWWGTNKENRFLMKPEFEPIPTAEGWQLSNSPVLLLAAHKASIDIFDEAGMDALIEKSKKLTGFLFQVLDDINSKQDHEVIQVITPRDAHGCQVSMLMLERGKEIFDALINEGVIGDWREPNVIRVAPVPLYNSFEDIWKFGDIISRILKK